MNTDIEKESINNTLRYFFDGLDNLDAGMIKKAFHPEARSFCVMDSGLGSRSVSHWDDTIRDAQDDPNHLFREKSRKNIVFIDITGDAASAKVEWVFTDLMFIDYYNLLKLDGRWYIMNKIYHTTLFEK
ncbi:MAG: nuclear transport factor 2 family protein [candidate division Zixibacteria bacterium]|nr:nuclear transport factor 2 family protein [candidate division Zixibacteria bacterium]